LTGVWWDQKVAQIAYDVIRSLENQPETLPNAAQLTAPAIHALVQMEFSAGTGFARQGHFRLSRDY
jgi:hypothetical protein